MDEYEERTLSVIAPEQEVRFVLLASQAHLVPLFVLRDSKFVRIGTDVSTLQFRSTSTSQRVGS